MSKVAQKFLELLEQSVILQAVLTVLIWGSVVYMILAGKAVPEGLMGAANLVLGFYFGSKMTAVQAQAYKQFMNRQE